MKYEFQVRMQQRHLNAIVGALRFRQRFLAGDVYGTIGRAAMDAWRVLPEGDFSGGIPSSQPRAHYPRTLQSPVVAGVGWFVA